MNLPILWRQNSSFLWRMWGKCWRMWYWLYFKIRLGLFSRYFMLKHLRRWADKRSWDLWRWWKSKWRRMQFILSKGNRMDLLKWTFSLLGSMRRWTFSLRWNLWGWWQYKWGRLFFHLLSRTRIYMWFLNSSLKLHTNLTWGWRRNFMWKWETRSWWRMWWQKSSFIGWMLFNMLDWKRILLLRIRNLYYSLRRRNHSWKGGLWSWKN